MALFRNLKVAGCILKWMIFPGENNKNHFRDGPRKLDMFGERLPAFTSGVSGVP